MSANEALEQLQRGRPVSAITPAGVRFRIESRLALGVAWYRATPAKIGCLKRWSRLSDSELLQWLNNVTITGEVGQ